MNISLWVSDFKVEDFLKRQGYTISTVKQILKDMGLDYSGLTNGSRNSQLVWKSDEELYEIRTGIIRCKERGHFYGSDIVYKAGLRDYTLKTILNIIIRKIINESNHSIS